MAALLEVGVTNGVPDTGSGEVYTINKVAKLEDVASADADGGIPAMAVRKATPANTSGTDGDYEFLQMSAGRLWTSATLDAAIPAGTNNIGDVDVLTINGVAPAFGTGAFGASVLRTVSCTDDPIVTAITAGTVTTGTAGTASAAVVTMQGIAAMVPVATVGKSNVYQVTPSTDTAAYASGDLIADTQQMDAFFRVADGTGVIQSITITDEEAQNVKFYIIFMKTSTSLGSENSAPNISDANLSAGYLGHVTVETTDWITVSGCSVATKLNIGMPVEAVSGTDDLYFAILNATGAPDWDADSLKLNIGVLLD
jgi:hypothetical protein